MDSDLIARLRETGLRDDYDAYRAADALEEQARRIKQLEAELSAGNDWLNARHAVLQDLAEANVRIAELEAALRPFADVADYTKTWAENEKAPVPVFCLRAARAAYLGEANGT